MDILVLSDTHGYLDKAITQIELMQPDMVIHLGDHLRDGEELEARFPGIPFHCVRGNCDRAGWGREELLLELCGRRIFAAHGHKQYVKRDLYGIYFAALDDSADIALFGHTHHATVREKDGILLLNPGSAGYGNSTAAVLTLSEGAAPVAEIIEL